MQNVHTSYVCCFVRKYRVFVRKYRVFVRKYRVFVRKYRVFVRKYRVFVNYSHTTVTLLSLLHRLSACSKLAVKLLA